LGDVWCVVGAAVATTTPESEVVVAAELLSDIIETSGLALMVCESEMGLSDLDPESDVVMGEENFLCCIFAVASLLCTTLAVLMTGTCLAAAGTLVPLTRPVSMGSASRFEPTAVLGYGGGGGKSPPPPPPLATGAGLGLGLGGIT
jgi:hypothetical protein